MGRIGPLAELEIIVEDRVDAQNVVSPEVWIRDQPWLDKDDADIDGYVASLPELPDYDLAGALRDWQRDGLVVFRNVVSQDVIDQYLEDIRALIRDYSDYEIPIEIRGEQITSRKMDAFPEDMTGVKLNHMQCFSRAAARLSLTPRIADFLGHLFKGPASVCQSLTFWRGSEQAIHIDYPYVRQQKKLSYLAASWIALEDIHPDSGPLRYWPGGHRLDRSGFFDWGAGSIVHDEHSVRSPTDFAAYLYDQMRKAEIEPREFCPNRGDVLIWHGNLPHEGTAVRNPALTRKAYVTHYTAEATLPDWMRNHDDNGARIGEFSNGGYSWRYRWFDGIKNLPSWEQEDAAISGA